MDKPQGTSVPSEECERQETAIPKDDAIPANLEKVFAVSRDSEKLVFEILRVLQATYFFEWFKLWEKFD